MDVYLCLFNYMGRNDTTLRMDRKDWHVDDEVLYKSLVYKVRRIRVDIDDNSVYVYAYSGSK